VVQKFEKPQNVVPLESRNSPHVFPYGSFGSTNYKEGTARFLISLTIRTTVSKQHRHGTDEQKSTVLKLRCAC